MGTPQQHRPLTERTTVNSVKIGTIGKTCHLKRLVN